MLAGHLLVLCGALHSVMGVMVSLSEPSVNDRIIIALGDSPRSIPLVLGNSYKISCEGESTWYRNGTAVLSDEPGTGISGVYTMEDSNSINLQLQRLSEGETGQYMCRNADEEEFILNITTGNPVLIANREVIGLDRDAVRSGTVPSLTVFGSGTPQPPESSYSWYFNGDPIFANGEEVGNADEVYLSLQYNRILLNPDDINEAIGGVYVCVVNTSAGETNVTIQLNVQVKPSPKLAVYQPSNYTTQFIANGEMITFKCNDTNAVPTPAFSWTVDGSADVEGVSVRTENDGRESYLTIMAVNQNLSGVEVTCTASNTVEDKEEVITKTISLRVWAPPPPPVNLTVLPSSACQVELGWLPPPLPLPDLTLTPQYFLIEAQPGSDGGWVVVDTQVNVFETRHTVDITNSTGVRNVSYNFRIRSTNARGGASHLITELTEPVQLYYENLPSVSSLSVSPLSSPPTSLSLTWSNPPSSCYLFVSHKAVCTLDDDSFSEKTSEPVGGGATGVMVTDLMVDSSYSCVVNSVVSDREGEEFSTMALSDAASGFTYPAHPMAPPQPKPSNRRPFSTNITVEFSLAEDHSDISHYQVLVVRVRAKENLPSDNLDDLYPSDYPFLDEDTVNDPKIDKRLHGPYIAAEMAGESFNRIFTLGSGGLTGPNSIYKNGRLLSETKYSCFLRAFPKSTVLLSRGRRQTGGEEGRQYAVFSSSPFMEVQETGPQPGSEGSGRSGAFVPAIASGVVVSLLLLVLIALLVIIFCVLRRRKSRQFHLKSRSESFSSSSKGSLDFPQTTTPDLCRKATGMELKAMEFNSDDERELIPSGPIPVNMFKEHVEKFDENRQLLFQCEFDWIQVNAPTYPAEASSLPVNDDKNRYSNIKAFDQSRVVLSPIEGVEGSDYINANYILGYNRTYEYISTQGPLDQTVVDFWRMVWEQNTATIVMLTNLVEVGKVKCAQYWPTLTVGTLTFGDLEVEPTSAVELRDYTIRNFTLKHVPSGECHTVLQFHYTKWPDYGTPKRAAPLLNFLRAVRTSNPSDVGPIVIHCSAGVGRSGTVICIDFCLSQLKADHVIDARGFVSRMRENRNYMIQTEVQYAFIHYALLEAITYGDTSFPLSEFPHSYQHLQQKNKETGQTLLQEEFSRLGSVKTMSKTTTFVQRVKQKGPTNRSIHFPGHASYSEGANPHEYNANFIDAYFTSKLFIVANGPEDRNVTKFWQMVWDQDCSYIIMLTPLDAHYYSYWPGKGEGETYGNIRVTVEEENAEHYYTTRVISVSNAKLGVSQKVTQYQFVGWTTQYLPPVPTFVSFVCEVLKGVETLQKQQKALIHDIKSVGPAGIFCSLCFCIERLRIERMVDVFQAVQSMQLQRPGTLQSMQDYAFVYDCVYEFIRTHSTS